MGGGVCVGGRSAGITDSGVLLSWGVESWPVAGRCHPPLIPYTFSVRSEVCGDQGGNKV